MSSFEEKALIFSHWFRKLIDAEFSVADICKIVVEFGKEYETFDETSLLSISWMVQIMDNGDTVYQKANENRRCSVFGKMKAYPGRMYHWKLKIIEMTDFALNIGVIEANKISDNVLKDLWNRSFGYSYFAVNCYFYHYGKGETPIYKTYGEECGKGDLRFDIWLDLRQNKHELSFGRNDKTFGKAADMEQTTSYRLVIGMFGEPKKIRIISLDITR